MVRVRQAVHQPTPLHKHTHTQKESSQRIYYCHEIVTWSNHINQASSKGARQEMAGKEIRPSSAIQRGESEQQDNIARNSF